MSLFLTDILAWTYAGPEGSASGPRRPTGSSRPGASLTGVRSLQSQFFQTRARNWPAARPMASCWSGSRPQPGFYASESLGLGEAGVLVTPTGWVAGGEKLAPSVCPS